MDRHEKKVAGVYASEQEAIEAVEDLIAQGYRKDEISVIGKNLKHVNHVTDETGASAEDTAATGAITGGTVGGVTGLLVGVGALAIPGVGPIIAAGPLAATLIGALTGAGLGGIAGALVGLGIPDDEAKYYGNSVEEGKILVLTEKRHTADINDRNYLPDREVEHASVLREEKNGSMARNMEEMRKLGKEMNQSQSETELKEVNKTPDPIQK
ncbi:general stress protein [Neobacillus bataviensis]|uniref:general stress protein n=1 Tax=Neobacillus bataviensis TaxID=220685 RepID=UPI001CBCF818|nr:general stress protein [Neobacillus bataviensis]